MGFRDDNEALRERLNESEHARDLLQRELDRANASGEAAGLRAKLQLVESELADAERWMAEANERANRKQRMPPGALQRAAVFGGAIALTCAAIAGLVLAVGAIADGCSHPLHAGYITERAHHEAYTTHGEICTGSGSSRVCTPTTTHHPERWSITVADGEQQGDYDLSLEDWEQTTNGEWFCVTPPCTAAPPPHAFDEFDH